MKAQVIFALQMLHDGHRHRPGAELQGVAITNQRRRVRRNLPIDGGWGSKAHGRGHVAIGRLAAFCGQVIQLRYVYVIVPVGDDMVFVHFSDDHPGGSLPDPARPTA